MITNHFFKTKQAAAEFAKDTIQNFLENSLSIMIMSPELSEDSYAHFVIRAFSEGTEIPNSSKQLMTILRNRQNYLSHLRSEELNERKRNE